MKLIIKAYFYFYALCSVLLLLPLLTASAPTNETDRLGLLKLKESIINDPKGVLRSWNNSIHLCNWVGVKCSKRHHRVIGLDIGGYMLSGSISPFIANLSFLRTLNLQNNSFHGQIPVQLGHLFRLQFLHLANNTLKGDIPTSLANCSALKLIDLSNNNFSGTIPFQFGSFQKLQWIHLAKNKLTGGIPSSLGNISSLTFFSLTYNYLEGVIPHSLGLLKNLAVFQVGANTLSGLVPSSVYNISSLNLFSIGDNQLNGTLPQNIGFTLPNLQAIEFGGNQLSGSLPISLSNISGLQVIDINGNYFSGAVPMNLGNLQDLWWLGLGQNQLGNHSSNDLTFLTSLVNCSKLEFLDLGINNFTGVLPELTVSNLSTQITELYFDVNKISGSIPAEIGNLINLEIFTLEKNLFTGIIPTSFGKLQNMQVMDLSTNNLSGQIPSSIGNMTLLNKLYFHNNVLEGNIPSSMGNCQNLQYLDMSQSNLSGAIPGQVIGLSSLSRLLNLSGNSLSGNIPKEVGNLRNIDSLDLSENNLSGEIPDIIGDCMSLEYLYLQGNSFHGNIPSTMTSMRALLVLDLSRNNLSGEISKDFEKFPSFVHLNFSFNKLEGEVPDEGVFKNTSAISLMGNNLLCGGVKELKLPSCPVKVIKHGKSHSLKKLIIVTCSVVFCILLATIFAIHWVAKSNKSRSASLKIEDVTKVSYRRLHQATQGFSPQNLIGSGGFGSVYKGTFDSEAKEVAIKVLNLQKEGASKSFTAECNALKNVRHRNLVKVLTCCSGTDHKGKDFKALVFEFLVNGSLDRWLHPDEDISLSLIQRLNIAVDVASALHYLHYECGQTVIHCDLKPSNILLDSDMVAHVSDFGLARILIATKQVEKNQSSTIGLKGSVGYAAPGNNNLTCIFSSDFISLLYENKPKLKNAEYGMGGEASMQGDVYSFGILLLEMFTGKRPTHEMFGNGMSLHNFVRLAFPGNLVDVIDPILVVERNNAEEGNINDEYGREEIEEEEDGESIVKCSFRGMDPKMERCLISVIEVGLSCSLESPRERLTMEVATRKLHLIKQEFLLEDGKRRPRGIRVIRI